MLELLQGFPENVIAAKGSGEVTGEDYNNVLIPAVEEALKQHDKIRCYYELGKDFSGFDATAAWEDTKVGFGHLSRWERVAVVTDVQWITWTMRALCFLFPIRVFPTSQQAEAREWIVAAA